MNKIKALQKAFLSFVMCVAIIAVALFPVACGKGGEPELSIKTMPTKVAYNVGETFSAAGGVLEYKANGKTTPVDMTAEGVEITKPGMGEVGTKTVSVTYKGLSVTFSISVTESSRAASAVEIKELPLKTNYLVGQNFVAGGGVLKVTYADDNSQGYVDFKKSSVAITGYDMSKAGEQAVTVSFGGKSATYKINVRAATEDEKKQGRISISKKPTKNEYFPGERFDLSGGELQVTIDGVKQTMAFDDIRVTVDVPYMEEETLEASKDAKVNVYVGVGKQAPGSFNTTIVAIGGKITYKPQLAGVEDFVVKLKKAQKVTAPTAPTKDGYTFYKWYLDDKCTKEYIFGSEISGNAILYGFWKEGSATYFDVNFKLNYYGEKVAEFPQIVKSGDKPRKPVDPERNEFTFGGWYSDEAGSTAFDTNVAVTAKADVYAKWNKTKTGSSTYHFEAENVDLEGKSGVGYSNNAEGAQMVVSKPELEACQGKAISYMYLNGNTLEFYIASDSDCTAKLVLRLANERDPLEGKWDGKTFNKDILMVEYGTNLQNLTSVDYSITVTKGGNFSDYEIGNINLKKGANVIRLSVVNSLQDGTTAVMTAVAPMIDCVKLTTEGVLTWDGTKDLPKKYE